MNLRKGRSALIAGAAAALALATAVPANAATVSDPILDGLSSPLGLAVGSDGTVYVTQSDFFGGSPGSVTELRKGTASVIGEGGFVTAVEANGRGTTSYLADAQLKVVNPSGKTKTLANLAEYEAMYNPDAGNDYGLQGLSPACAGERLPPCRRTSLKRCCRTTALWTPTRTPWRSCPTATGSWPMPGATRWCG